MTGQDGEAGERAPAFTALLALTLASPLALGAYAPWAWGAMAAACGALLCLWGASALSGRRRVARPPRFVLWSAAAAAPALLWALAQTAGATPERWHHPLWGDAAAALGTRYWGAVSLDPAAGRDGALRIAMYAALFWLALQHGTSPRRARKAIRAVALGSACHALYGMAALLSGAERILWLEKTAYLDAATGTFVNPNSFGAYCGIGLVCATAALARPGGRGPAGGGPGLKRRLRRLLGWPGPGNGPLAAAWLALAAALAMSLSRAAAAATGIALLTLLGTLAASRGRRIRAGRWVAGALACALLALLLGPGLERRLWDAGPDWAKRAQIYSQTVEAIADAPLAGTGLGTFESVYRSRLEAGVRPGARMAHNDYLEAALELGIPAAALLVCAGLALAVGCGRGALARRRDAAVPAAGLAACVLVGAHSLVDFSLQIPAVAATFALVLGTASAQARPGRGAAQ